MGDQDTGNSSPASPSAPEPVNGMLGLVQALWDQMRADFRTDAMPQLMHACRSLLDGSLGALTEKQIEDLEAVARSISKLSRRVEGEPINWADHSEAAHALRGPLNSTIGFSRLIIKGVDGPINEAQKELLGRIYAISRRLLALFNLLLEALLLFNKEMSFSIARVSVDEILEELITVGHTLADHRGFTFQTDVTEQTIGAAVQSDVRRVKQALSALLAVAVKYAGDSVVSLRAWLKEDQLLIQLENQACQLPKPLLTNLACLFTDAVDHPYPYDAHLRLGLAWRLLAEMAGCLEAQQTDQTCTFTVALPLA